MSIIIIDEIIPTPENWHPNLFPIFICNTRPNGFLFLLGKNSLNYKLKKLLKFKRRRILLIKYTHFG